MTHIIGQKQQQAPEPVHLDVTTDSGHVLFTITLLGSYGMARAHIAPDAALGVMKNVGMYVETLTPGVLIPAVEAWLAQMKHERASAQNVLKALKFDQT